MRKLKLQVQTTVDGRMGGPNQEMDWMTLPWSSDISAYIDRITDPVDTILLGRKLADGFIPYWSKIASDPNNEEFAAGKKYIDTRKVVFSQTLKQCPWPNTEVASGELKSQVLSLKRERGGDIIVYGGSSFVSSLIKEDLIDEYHLFINPATVGEGLPVFKNRTNLILMTTQAFDCGIVVLMYGRK